MLVEVKIDGQSLVNMELNETLLTRLLGSVTAPIAVARSTPITLAQTEALLSRIDGRSVQFLKQIAANNGKIAWGEMRRIFGITNGTDSGWSEFSASYGKGITRALRHLTGDKSARLVWWDDAEWPNGSAAGSWDSCNVYVDGPALESLRSATGIA
jgi:hypothetical protein